MDLRSEQAPSVLAPAMLLRLPLLRPLLRLLLRAVHKPLVCRALPPFKCIYKGCHVAFRLLQGHALQGTAQHRTAGEWDFAAHGQFVKRMQLKHGC